MERVEEGGRERDIAYLRTYIGRPPPLLRHQSPDSRIEEGVTKNKKVAAACSPSPKVAPEMGEKNRKVCLERNTGAQPVLMTWYPCEYERQAGRQSFRVREFLECSQAHLGTFLPFGKFDSLTT